METEELGLIENNVENKFEIIVKKSLILKALAHIQSVVEKKNIIPILSNVKITAFDNILEMVATDMEIEIKETIAVQTINQGSFTINSATFYEVIRKLPDDEEVNIKIDEKYNKILILCDSCKFLLSYLDSNKFPSINFGDLPFSIVLRGKDLIKIIESTKYSMSTDETRYNINGIFIHTKEKQGEKFLRAAATDGHRLSVVEIKIEEEVNNFDGVILPRKAVLELSKLIDSSTDQVLIEFSNNKAIFTFDNIVMVSKLLDGIFPDYEELIPQDNKTSMKIDKKKFASSIDRISTIAFDKLKSIKFIIRGNILTLSSTGESSDSADEIIDIECESNDIDVGFNSRYLLEIIISISNETVECFFGDDLNSAVIFKGYNDNSALHVVMPMLI